jgi:hypothetical protein
MGGIWRIGPLIAVFLIVADVGAQKRLVVGPGGMAWTEVWESSAFVEVADDSVWIWDADPGQNLGPGTLARGGGIYVAETREVEVGLGEFDEEKVLLPEVRAVEAMIDGDESTAFNPAEVNLKAGIEVYVDLGGTFRINRVRFFPRLDSEHLKLFPQTFELGLGGLLLPLSSTNALLGQRYGFLIRYAITRPNDRAIVDWPGIRQVTGTREARYLRFQPLSDIPWEIAELEIYTDGIVPTGEFASMPLLASSGAPVWGQVRHEGGKSLDELPVVLQTRTGPDEEPLHYYIQTGARVRRVNREVWEVIEDIPGAAEKGPVVPNPEWSQWETVVDGVIPSPSPRRFLQFRVRLLEAGARLERLVFDYSTPPLAGQVQAEISPTVVDAGRETPFVLSLQMRRLEKGSDTGFRFIEIQTLAEIIGVDSVRVDDRPVVFTADTRSEGGIGINLWERLLQDGSFVQIFFRGRLFVDGTRFQVRALDRRYLAEGEEDTVYQYAQEGDVEPLSLGAALAVRLSDDDSHLVAGVATRGAAFSPNDDGINDFFTLAYSLLKLTRPAPVFFEIFDLSGNLLRRGYAGEDVSGRFVRLWNGRDDAGNKVAPGLYIYRMQVEADAGTVSRQGVVGVVH